MKKSSVQAIINHPPKGITLITLIVTIIILLILAGVSIALISSGNGILNKASEALETNQEAEATEKMELKITGLNIVSYGENTRKATLQELAEGLFVDKEIEYVKIKDEKVASLENINVNGESSIFVKLKEYPYEFEINSDLHLASVDGVKVTTGNETVTISKEEYENLKPNSVTEDSLLLNSKNLNLAVGTYNFNNFTHDYGNAFEKYFLFNEETGELVCQKSGWYCIELRVILVSHSVSYSETLLSAYVNGTKLIWAHVLHAPGGVDTNSMTLFLNKDDKVTFTKGTYNTDITQQNETYVEIFKL